LNTNKTLPEIKLLTDVEYVNSKSKTFMVYDNKIDKNLLFMGSCRTVQLAFYFNNLNIPHLKRNIYILYVPHWSTDELRESLPRDVILKILDKTDIIICESIERFGILNTYEHLEQNFFKHFDVKNKLIFHIPNIELRMFHYEITRVFKRPIHEVAGYFHKSKEHILNKLKVFGYEKVAEFIERNITKIKLFSTFNHPTRVVMLLLFKYLALKMGIHLPASFFTEMDKYNFIEGNELPVIQKDINLYNLKFSCTISDELVLGMSDVYVKHPKMDYKFVDTEDFIIF
jgi:hypothetical protein